MSEDRESPLVRARRELDAFEAAVFQFGQRTRAFLDAFPTDLPEPLAVLPKFGSATVSDGGTEHGAKSYLHLTFAEPDEVEAWATRLGTLVTRSVEPDGRWCFARTEGVLGDSRVFAGCMTTPTDQERQQARLRDVTEGGVS